MWLVTTALAATAVTISKSVLPKKYKLDFLALMLWGATVMILIDHLLGYEGGQFIQTRTDGLINNSFILGIVMLIPVIVVWLVSVLVGNLKELNPELRDKGKSYRLY